MKTILASAAIVCLAIGAFADIQDPPGNDYGPTRKLGRGISNRDLTTWLPRHFSF